MLFACRPELPASKQRYTGSINTTPTLLSRNPVDRASKSSRTPNRGRSNPHSTSQADSFTPLNCATRNAVSRMVIWPLSPDSTASFTRSGTSNLPRNGIDADFQIVFFATRFVKGGFGIAGFEYPYKASQRSTSRQMPSDRELILRETGLQTVVKQGREGLAIGGTSSIGCTIAAGENRLATSIR